MAHNGKIEITMDNIRQRSIKKEDMYTVCDGEGVSLVGMVLAAMIFNEKLAAVLIGAVHLFEDTGAGAVEIEEVQIFDEPDASAN